MIVCFLFLLRGQYIVQVLITLFFTLSSTIRIPRNTRGETLSINYFAAVYHASISMQNAKFPVPQSKGEDRK